MWFPTNSRITTYYFLFGLLISLHLPFFALNTYASTDYFDIISQEKKVTLDWNEQWGQEYQIIYENLFLDITVVEEVGPLQGYFQISITYDNLETDGQTSLNLNLERINFFLDLNGDQCQSWTAAQISSGFGILDVDNLLCSITPLGSIDWIKKDNQFNRTCGVEDFRLIPFFKTKNETDLILNWGIQEKLIFAMTYENVTYWNYNITLDLCLMFHFFIRDNTAYLEHDIRLENCSVHEWIPILLEFTSVNLALEWNSEVTVTQGLAESSVYWSLNNLFYECVTVLGVSEGRIVDDNTALGSLTIGTTYLKNNLTSLPLYTSAIPLQKRVKSEFTSEVTKLRYAQTIPNYDSENITVASKFEFYFASSTLNVIFIVFFNVLLSVILLRKGLKFKRRAET